LNYDYSSDLSGNERENNMESKIKELKIDNDYLKEENIGLKRQLEKEKVIVI
jgi:hypothetical protein